MNDDINKRAENWLKKGVDHHDQHWANSITDAMDEGQLIVTELLVRQNVLLRTVAMLTATLKQMTAAATANKNSKPLE